MYEQINKRLAELNQQFEQGNVKLIRMERERTELRETLFRIQGAIMVLKEFSVQSGLQDPSSDLVEETAEICVPVSLGGQITDEN